jgi:hypothetical protein
LTPTQAHDDGARIAKHASKGGERDEAWEAVDVGQSLDFCHPDFVTEFLERAIAISPGNFQGIRALTHEIHPLKNEKSLKKYPE